MVAALVSCGTRIGDSKGQRCGLARAPDFAPAHHPQHPDRTKPDMNNKLYLNVLLILSLIAPTVAIVALRQLTSQISGEIAQMGRSSRRLQMWDCVYIANDSEMSDADVARLSSMLRETCKSLTFKKEAGPQAVKPAHEPDGELGSGNTATHADSSRWTVPPGQPGSDPVCDGRPCGG